MAGEAALPDEDVARRVLWELSVDAAGIGTFDWDLTTDALVWDDRMLEMFGYDRESFTGTIDAFRARVHPDDLRSVLDDVQRAVEGCGSYDLEYRVLVPGAPTRWVAARGRVLCDEDGAPVRVLGAAHETTARREGEARVARVLESMPTAFYSLDHDWRFSYVNAPAEQALGCGREDLLGRSVWEAFPAAVGTHIEAHYRTAMSTGRPVTFETYYPAPLDAWFEVRAWPGPDGLAVYGADITERRRTEERAALLARVTEQLTGTLDAQEAVAHLAQLVVPTLGDWCLVTLVDDEERGGGRPALRDIGAWHVDPAMRPVLDRYARTRLSVLRPESLLHRALSIGQPVVQAQDATAQMRSVLPPGEARDLVAILGPESLVVLPLRGRGNTVGLLSLFSGPARSPMTTEELAVAREVAGRAGLALDNARLYRQQRRMAEGLQRSLLTAPTEAEHVQVAVRYVPAAETAHVGGDWYDVFVQPDGATVLAIGDVLGHDTDAAATMGQVRSLLRGIAVHSGAGPADVLTGVDLALTTLRMETSASAVVVRLEQTPEERRRGVTRARWSNAGHPAPLAVRPGGAVVPLGGAEPDLLLGVQHDTRRVEEEAVVPAGTTLLLYTDGLVERRDQSLDEGFARLRETLEDLAGQDLGLDDLCDQVLARMLPVRAQDDVALLAVRLHPQDVEDASGR